MSSSAATANRRTLYAQRKAKRLRTVAHTLRADKQAFNEAFDQVFCKRRPHLRRTSTFP